MKPGAGAAVSAAARLTGTPAATWPKTLAAPIRARHMKQGWARKKPFPENHSPAFQSGMCLPLGRRILLVLIPFTGDSAFFSRFLFLVANSHGVVLQ